MSSLQELQRIDRELSSELIESPINPAFLHMSTPLKSEYNPLFYLQINGEALWQWRKSNSDPSKVFDVLQGNLPKIGYKLQPSFSLCIGITVSSRVGYIVRKLRNISNVSTALKLLGLHKLFQITFRQSMIKFACELFDESLHSKGLNRERSLIRAQLFTLLHLEICFTLPTV